MAQQARRGLSKSVMRDLKEEAPLSCEGHSGIVSRVVHAFDVLLSQARSVKFNPRQGCGTAATTIDFTLQGN
jgi:hypothetical protein